MDNRHGLLAIFDNDLHTSTHVCQERRYVGRGSFFFRDVDHALSHSLIIQLATPNPHARKTGVEYPMEISETFPSGPSSGPGHSAAKVETGAPSHTSRSAFKSEQHQRRRSARRRCRRVQLRQWERSCKLLRRTRICPDRTIAPDTTTLRLEGSLGKTRLGLWEAVRMSECKLIAEI